MKIELGYEELRGLMNRWLAARGVTVVSLRESLLPHRGLHIKLRIRHDVLDWMRTDMLSVHLAPRADQRTGGLALVLGAVSIHAPSSEYRQETARTGNPVMNWIKGTLLHPLGRGVAELTEVKRQLLKRMEGRNPAMQVDLDRLELVLDIARLLSTFMNEPTPRLASVEVHLTGISADLHFPAKV